MILMPVIVRELRAQSRQPFTYWLRVVAGAAVVAVFTLVIVRYEAMGTMWKAATGTRIQGANPFSGLGALLFGYLNATLFICSVLIAPLLTADCISREKREGTLGLLFLTKLSAVEIVTGKSFVHALRGITLFAAMLPLLAVPVLLGGVSAKDCLMALLIDSTVLVLGLSAGLLASAFTKDWVRAFVLAELLSITSVVIYIFSHGTAFHDLFAGTRIWSYHSSRSVVDAVAQWFRFHSNFASFHFNQAYIVMAGTWIGPTPQSNGIWSDVWSNVPAHMQREWFRLASRHLAGSLLLLYAAIAVAAWRVRRAWRQEPVVKPTSGVTHSFTRPRFAVQTLHRRLSRSLQRNPIGWLHQYSWHARLTKWGWCLAIVLLECAAAADLRTIEAVQPFAVMLLLSGLAFSAAGSFRRERETGALELLLVCPLSVNQIIGGRVRGVWKQFLPALLVVFLSMAVVHKAEFFG
ncbi:MAG: ABC transporter permease subunit, partial [Verrucomicrobia subdivision 3 bacterium]|nr:ABC transporter permease subunit [Limisphaerales bacterium]